MTFPEITDAYLAERRAVGLKMERGEMRMAGICALHDEMGCAPDELPRAVVEAWSELRPGESETNRLGRVSQIRCLAEYMVRMGYDAYVAPRGHGWRDRGSYEPHIFTDDEVRALFEASDRLAGGDLCCQRAQAALVLRLLYSTGMRCGEACSLGKADVDLAAGIITVRHAKNDKDRLVPVHASVSDRLHDAPSVRRRLPRLQADGAQVVAAEVVIQGGRSRIQTQRHSSAFVRAFSPFFR